MGKVYVVDLDPTSDCPVEMCKQCRTHIGLGQNFECFHTPEPGPTLCLFNEVVNVRIDEPVNHRYVGDHRVADIFCISCDENLGWKYINVAADEPKIQNNWVHLKLEKLLLLTDGDTILDCETMAPVLQNA